MWSLRTTFMYYVAVLLFYREKRRSIQNLTKTVADVYPKQTAPEVIPSFIKKDKKIRCEESTFEAEPGKSINKWQMFKCWPANTDTEGRHGHSRQGGEAEGDRKVMIHFHGGAFFRAVSVQWRHFVTYPLENLEERYWP
jgi:hypothetical protein